jgi:hypothetical protein
MLDQHGRKAIRIRNAALFRGNRISYAALIGRKNPLSSTGARG